MGWTWVSPSAMVQLYPTLANVPELLERWPALREAFDLQRLEVLKNNTIVAAELPVPDTPPPAIS